MPAPAPLSLRTERLLLRRWQRADLDPFAALNADPDVMEFMPRLLSRNESDTMVDRITASFAERGFGLWAVETVDGAEFVGFTGLNAAEFDAPFTPAVEVGWRLARSAWGHGYATEAAQVSVADGFDRLGLDEIVSFTAAINARSIGVMERLGMTRDPAEDFDHPSVAAGDPLRRHVLYRLRRPTS